MSESINQFDENSMRKIAKSVFRENRRSIANLSGNVRKGGRGGLSRQSNEVFPIKFHNSSGQVIPARALMQIIDTDIKKGREIYNVRKPNGNADASILINGSQDIAIDGDGFGTWGTDGCLFLHDNSEAITAGDIFGAKSGQWKAYKGLKGFKAFGNPYGDFAMGIQETPADGVPFINESGQIIPKFAVMQINLIDDNYVYVTKPTYPITGLGFLINGNREVPVNGQGVGNYGFDKHTIILTKQAPYSFNGGAESFGVVPGKWYISNEYLGNITGTSSGSVVGESIGFWVYSESGEDDVTVDSETCHPCYAIQYHEQPVQSLDLRVSGFKNTSGVSITHLGDDEPEEGYLSFYNASSHNGVNVVTPPPHRYRLGVNYEVEEGESLGHILNFERGGIYKIEITLRYKIDTIVETLENNELGYVDEYGISGESESLTGTTVGVGTHNHDGEVPSDGGHSHDFDYPMHTHNYHDMLKMQLSYDTLRFTVSTDTGDVLFDETHRPALLKDGYTLLYSGVPQIFTRHAVYVGSITTATFNASFINSTSALYRNKCTIEGGFIRVERLRSGLEVV